MRRLWTLFCWMPLAWTLAACSPQQASTFSVQRPAKVAVDSRLKKIFIDPAQIEATNDRLDLRAKLLGELKKQIEAQGRFQVILGPVAGVDLNLEPVAVIQGQVTSKEGSETGQFTEVATCQGGLGGFAAGASQIDKKQGVTVSQRGLLCRTDSTESALIGAGVGMALSLMTGEKQKVDPLDEVLRVYAYKNLNFYAQFDLNVTVIGESRQTVTIASESANFSRHLIQPAINVHDTSMGIGALGVALGAPVFPVPIERVALAKGTNPGHAEGRWTNQRAKSWVKRDLSAGERKEVIERLVELVVQPVVRRVSPYKEAIRANLASGGSVEVEELLRQGEWLQARQKLNQAGDKNAADLYHLGLTFEGAAQSEADYVQAQDLYRRALEAEEAKVYAEGIGRMERRLAEMRQLKQQMEVKG